MKDIFYSISFGLILGLMIGLLVQALTDRSIFNAEAIKHNAAHYDQQTGNWEWNQ